MENKVVKPRKFELPAAFVIEDVADSELLAETLEKDSTQLWLFQTHADVNLSEISNQELQLKGIGQIPFGDMPDKMLSTFARDFSSDDDQFQLVVPNKNGKLQCVNKVIHGHVQLSEAIQIPKFERPSSPKQQVDHLIMAKQRYFPYGGQPLPANKGRKKKKSKICDIGNTAISNDGDLEIKSEVQSDSQNTIKNAEAAHKHKKKKKLSNGVINSTI